MPRFVLHLRAIVDDVANAAEAEDIVLSAMDDVPAAIYLDKVTTERVGKAPVSGTSRETGLPKETP